VSEARGQAYAELYRKLNTKESENDIYKMAKLRERKTRDFNHVKYIKNEADRLLVKDDEINNRLREYFDKLFNDENEKTTIKLDDSVDDINRRFVQRIQESKMKESLKK
jgi:thymidylate kinase